MRFTVRRRRQPPAVIIVSLIDIMIVLLIFLMVTTTFKDAPALRLTLPESKQTELKPGANENPPLIVTITTNQPYFYLGKIPSRWSGWSASCASGCSRIRALASPSARTRIRPMAIL